MAIILEGQRLDDLIEREAKVAGVELTDADRAWLRGMVMDWQRSSTPSTGQLIEIVRSRIRYVVPPVDMDGQPITVGCTVLAPWKSGGAGDGACIKRMVVVSIENPEHRGYGYYTRTLKLRGQDGKKQSHFYPSNCLVIQPSTES